MGKIVLVTGGARSGKSRFAEKYASKFGEKIAYIATAEVYDEEMAFRVKLHKERRPKDWTTIDAPYDAQDAIRSAGENHDMILFDCLTIYISNLILAQKDFTDSKENYRVLEDKIGQLIKAAKEITGTVIFVTNEVGSGIVPENHLSREYRDIAGLANQFMGKAADEVYLVTCSIPVEIKHLAEPWMLA